jgi:O-antigen biosynthesis protein
VASAIAEAPDDVLVVIDHNAELFERAIDNLRALNSTSRSTRVRVIANEKQSGLSGARNMGIAATDTTIVAFIDDDAEVLPGWIGHLVAPFSDESVVAVGGRAMPARPDRFPGWWPQEYNWVVGCSWTGLPEALTEVRNVIGCCMAFRRDALVETNGFDPALGRVGSNAAGCEETELCLRLRRGGARVLYEPRATVLHHVDDRRLTARYFIRRCWAEGRSKARISRSLGGASLGPERRFALDALRQSVSTGARATISLEWSGIARAAALAGGLCTTGLGFAWPVRK